MRRDEVAVHVVVPDQEAMLEDHHEVVHQLAFFREEEFARVIRINDVTSCVVVSAGRRVFRGTQG